MYLDFYGLSEKPFNTTPDPKFLYMSPGHREALAQLLYGTQERTGFILLTGKVGAGKTVLLHTLRQRLSGHSAIAFVRNSTLPFDELLEYVFEDLGISKPGQSRAQRLIFQQLPDRAGANRSNHRAHHRSYAPDFSEHVGTRRPFRHLCWGGRIR